MSSIAAILIGMIFLLIDVKLTGIIPYPEFEEFPAIAEKTADMIINHVVGDSLPIDVFSDVAGYIIIIVVCAKVVNKNDKAFRCFCLGILALGFYLFHNFMPFFFNGEARYNIASFSYIAMLLIKCVAFIQAGLVCTQTTECVENHAANLVTEIFFMLAAFCGFIRGMAFFYNLPRTMYFFYGIQCFFAIIYHAVFIKILINSKDKLKNSLLTKEKEEV